MQSTSPQPTSIPTPKTERQDAGGGLTSVASNVVDFTKKSHRPFLLSYARTPARGIGQLEAGFGTEHADQPTPAGDASRCGRPYYRSHGLCTAWQALRSQDGRLGKRFGQDQASRCWYNGHCDHA